MQLEGNSVRQLARSLLERLVDAHDPRYGFGTMTCAIYDTAWLSMIPRTEQGLTEWLFPKCFFFLLDKQQPDGGWEATASPIDGILNTAAGLLSLCKHRETLYQISMSEHDLNERISLGRKALLALLREWEIYETLHVGFEILVPALLDSLEAYDMEFQFRGREALYNIRDVKLSMIDLQSLEDRTKPSHSILHCLEALYGHINFDKLAHHKVCGSLMASPSATAAYLIHTSSWDGESEAYLRHVLEHGEGRGDGSVPSAFPSTIFELTWVLSTLAAAGLSEIQLRGEALTRALNMIKDEFHAQLGLMGFAPQIQPDADDTAKGITCLNMLGVPASASGLVKSFGQGKWFKTYSEERNSSISTNCNALVALLSDNIHIQFYSPVIAKVTRHLCETWFQSISIQDKWNISSYYTIMLLAQALSRVSERWRCGELSSPDDHELYEEQAPLVLFQILIHILQGQDTGGSWDGSMEVTAYSILAIEAFKGTAHAQLLDKQIHDALRGGRSFLVRRFRVQQHPEMLWIEKVTYGSSAISEAYVLAALHSSSMVYYRATTPEPPQLGAMP
ncbi:hypothetical protein BO94DRAFT_628480 [Aspergillus sclerotioniger CBS 115572]|uniref:Ent-kaurene synthase n=1 Tax=Aspergillus sclerotioniger CBS 115572 TaxID=1450535 RepID=A0A317V8M2_9EURO|nr:hypothetical protein BO94DRAFT_628480 [Aspergillus sclerotioniger CBS 115572]PWY69651.1 hypothetical protein BO94DRAFT_628480 [Aspergillus sclerotioniger CBS 115572]